MPDKHAAPVVKDDEDAIPGVPQSVEEHLDGIRA